MTINMIESADADDDVMSFAADHECSSSVKSSIMETSRGNDQDQEENTQPRQQLMQKQINRSATLINDDRDLSQIK